MDLNIKGKKALVCGSSKGLGKAIATALAAEGVDLFLCARNTEQLAAVAKECSELSGLKVRTAAADLSDAEDRAGLIQSIRNDWDHLDILIHNSGGPKPSSVESTTLGDWEDGFNHLFPAVAHLNEVFVPAMKAQKWGRIVAVTSLSVLEPIENLAISNAMRSAVTAMLKTLADEVAKFDITVNCVAPGLINTDRTENLMNARISKSGQSPEEYMKEYVKPVPIGRLGTPEEFGAVVAFLCSQQASYVTGNTICIDGGKRRSVH